MADLHSLWQTAGTVVPWALTAMATGATVFTAIITLRSKERLDKARFALDESKQQFEIDSKRHALLTEDLNRYRDELAEMSRKLDALQDKYDALRDERIEEKALLVEARRQLGEAERHLKETTQLLEERTRERDLLQQEVGELKDQVQRLEKHVARLESAQRTADHR